MSELLYGMQQLGCKNGMRVFVSDAAIATHGERRCAEMLGLVKRWPVKTDLSGTVVMVEGATHEDAIQRYLYRTIAV
jgi:hypothetical protein